MSDAVQPQFKGKRFTNKEELLAWCRRLELPTKKAWNDLGFQERADVVEIARRLRAYPDQEEEVNGQSGASPDAQE